MTIFLEELYNAENQLIKAMPRITEAINSQELRSMVEDQLEKTKTRARRLQEIFKELEHEPDHADLRQALKIDPRGAQARHNLDKAKAIRPGPFF